MGVRLGTLREERHAFNSGSQQGFDDETVRLGVAIPALLAG
jgi:hypothetical protein